MSTCPVCLTAVLPLANATAVTTTTTEHGTHRILHFVCDTCGAALVTRISPHLAAVADWLLQARPSIDQLRVNYECEAILAREGLT